MDYTHWRTDRTFLLVPAQEYVGKYIATFKEFPPSQKVAASRSIKCWRSSKTRKPAANESALRTTARSWTGLWRRMDPDDSRKGMVRLLPDPRAGRARLRRLVEPGDFEEVK
jgi:hypothetical protein